MSFTMYEEVSVSTNQPSPRTRGKVGRFRTDEAKVRFEHAYDRALATWPMRARPVDVPTSFGRTRVNASGSESGTPIVLLHSMLATSTSWAPNIGALGADHPLYAVDTICDAGRGTQERPVRNGQDLHEWFEQVLARLELDRSHLVGLSFGAWIALNHALLSPARVRSVTAIEPPGAITRGRLRFLLKFVKAGMRRSDRDFDRIIELLGNGRAPSPEIVDVLRCGFRDYKLALPFAKLLTDERLRSMDTPMLVLFGSESPMSDGSKAVERALSLLPDVEAELVPGTAHTPPMEEPDEVNDRILRFLEVVESRRKDTVD
ncbi:MAG TPA: alpha/beta fold hydrolase [Actinomycetota bacterium]